MKKVIFLIFILTCICLPVAASSDADVTVVVNGEELICDVPGEIVEGRTFVPLRAIAEKLGAEVEWKSESRGITLKKGNRQTFLTIGSLSATITEGGKSDPASLEAAPYIKDGRTMVPLRFIAQGLNHRVSWCADLRAAVITEKSVRLEGDMKALTESFFSRLLPDAIKRDGETIAKDISENPQNVINYFSNIWTDEALKLLEQKISDEECEKFKSLSSDVKKQYEYLLEMGEKYSIPIECPVKMCALKNGSVSGILLDGQGEKIIDVSPLCVLKSIDGAVVAENL